MTHLSSQQLENKIQETLFTAARKALGESCGLVREAVYLERPRDESHGDLAANFVLKLAKELKKPPRDLGQEILKKFEEEIQTSELKNLIRESKVEGPGFINLTLSHHALTDILAEIEKEDKKFGSSTPPKPRRILLEFVSANPTGPLTIAHGRQAALGDSLMRILKFNGFDTHTEYYNNDVGVQIGLLGESLYARCREEAKLESNFPENGYKGEYLKEMGF